MGWGVRFMAQVFRALGFRDEAWGFMGVSGLP